MKIVSAYNSLFVYMRVCRLVFFTEVFILISLNLFVHHTVSKSSISFTSEKLTENLDSQGFEATASTYKKLINFPTQSRLLKTKKLYLFEENFVYIKSENVFALEIV